MTDQELWDELGRLPTPAPTVEQTDRIADRLQQQILQRREISPKAWWLAAALLAGVLLGGAGATLLSRAGSTPAGEQFLLLLHANPGSTIEPERLQGIVAEYFAWAGQLAREDRLVSAEKLADDGGRWITAQGVASVDAAQTIGGFFLIRADNYEAAVATARQSPHLRYGGTIEVRRIERTE